MCTGPRTRNEQILTELYENVSPPCEDNIFIPHLAILFLDKYFESVHIDIVNPFGGIRRFSQKNFVRFTNHLYVTLGKHRS